MSYEIEEAQEWAFTAVRDQREAAAVEAVREARMRPYVDAMVTLHKLQGDFLGIGDWALASVMGSARKGVNESLARLQVLMEEGR